MQLTLIKISFDMLTAAKAFELITKGRANFEMSFWCHRFDQNSNETIVRISALKVYIASWGLPVGSLINDV